MHYIFKIFVVFCVLIAVFTVQVPNSIAYENQQLDYQVKQYDLTSLEGWKSLAIENFITVVFPEYRLLEWLWNNLEPGNVVAKETELQGNTAVRIIEAGKQSNVDELEIKMSEKAGLSLETKIKDKKIQDNFSIDFVLGNSGEMTVKVKYKS